MRTKLNIRIAHKICWRVGPPGGFNALPLAGQEKYRQLARDVVELCRENAEWSAERARYPFRLWYSNSLQRLMIPLEWLDQPHDYLDGMTPKEALEHGEIGTDNLALELKLIRALVDAGRAVGAPR